MLVCIWATGPALDAATHLGVSVFEGRNGTLPGIFITAGMDLRISNLRIPLDGSAPPPVTASVRMDTWHHWLFVACDQVRVASDHEADLHQALAEERATGSEDSPRKQAALEGEFRGAMITVASCAFAVDAFYATVKERFGSHPDAERWKDNGIPRHGQIAATLHYRLKLKGRAMPVIRDLLKQLFKFRDMAVHPHALFSDPIYRADLNAGVEPRFVTYSAEHARKSLGLTVELMTVLMDMAEKVAEGENAQWATFAKERINAVRGAARAIQGVEFPDREETDTR